MNIDILELFVDVSRSGSFANTAKKRDLDPSSVSRSIASLETYLGVRLFRRTTRRLSLTEAGAIYLKRIEPICDELTNAREEVLSVQQRLDGRIRFSTSVSFGQACILPLLPELRKKYPKLDVELKLDDRSLDLIDEQLDFAIRLSKTADNRFVRSRLKTTHYRVCVAPEYLRQAKKITKPRDLSDHPAIVFDLPNYKSTWCFRSQNKEQAEVSVSANVTLSNALAIRDCTLRGLGVSLLADWLVDEDIQKGKLIQLFPEYKVSADNFDTAVWVVYPERAFLPTKTRLTIDFIRERLV